MMLIPFASGMQHYNILVVLERDNLARMELNDPAQLALKKLPPEWHTRTLDNVMIAYCPPREVPMLHRLMREGQVHKALAWVMRGFEFRPDLGDSDEDYKREAKS